MADDPADSPPVRSTDRGDDYSIALASAERAILVSGDQHLLALADDLPIFTVKRFLSELQGPG